MREITQILELPELTTTRGSSIPSAFFSNIASVMGIPIIGGMPQMARKIIEAAHLRWHESFSSELSPSGGGGTVTALGLLQVRNAALVWTGKPAEPLPVAIVFEPWSPAQNWMEKRLELERQEAELLIRPGSRDFRNLILTEYDYQCAVTRIKTMEAIEVAHIVPYFGPESDELQNALPLRVDLHRLFDRGLLRIEYRPSIRKYLSIVHESILKDYSEYHDKVIASPNDPLSAPSTAALFHHDQLFLDKWTVI
jgi:hypothetical protein